jgi:host factor-I protein
MKESVEPTNRKLIRPSLTEVKEQITHKRPQQQPQPKQKRTTPPDQTHAENFYYLKQMQNRTPMVLVLKDGEELRGYIEWYDRTCLKVNREGEPNLLVYKDGIKYLYKESERRPHGAGGSGARGKTNGAPKA